MLTVALQATYAQGAHPGKRVVPTADPHYGKRVVPTAHQGVHIYVSYSPTDLSALYSPTAAVPRITSASSIRVYLSDTVTSADVLLAEMQSIACMRDRCTDTGVIQP